MIPLELALRLSRVGVPWSSVPEEEEVGESEENSPRRECLNLHLSPYQQPPGELNHLHSFAVKQNSNSKPHELVRLKED